MKQDASKKVAWVEDNVWLANIANLPWQSFHPRWMRRLKTRDKLGIIQTFAWEILDRELPPHVMVHQRGVDERRVLTELALELVDLPIEELRTKIGIEVHI